MRQYFTRLENDHSVPQGTPGHGFDGFLDITVNSDEFLRNQTQGTEVLKATAKLLGQDPTKIFEIITNGTDLNNDDPNRDQQVGIFGFPAHRDLGRVEEVPINSELELISDEDPLRQGRESTSSDRRGLSTRAEHVQGRPKI